MNRENRNTAPHSGIILLDKPGGITSSTLVRKVKKKLKLPRSIPVGHAGTLDPMATGLLVCLIGGATKLSSYLTGGIKGYVGEIQLGITTSTDDREGEVIAEHDGEIPPFSEIVSYASHFRGQIKQVPPVVSAVRISGERSFKRVRRGEDVSLPPRTVTIYNCDFEETGEHATIRVRVTCSSGTYIRSIARDLGELLGVGGTLRQLKRISAGPFSLSDAIRYEDVDHATIRPWDFGFAPFPRIALSDSDLEALCHGNMRRVQSNLEESFKQYSQVDKQVFRVGSLESDSTLALLEREESGWKVRYMDAVERASRLNTAEDERKYRAS